MEPKLQYLLPLAKLYTYWTCAPARNVEDFQQVTRRMRTFTPKMARKSITPVLATYSHWPIGGHSGISRETASSRWLTPTRLRKSKALISVTSWQRRATPV